MPSHLDRLVYYKAKPRQANTYTTLNDTASIQPLAYSTTQPLYDTYMCAYTGCHVQSYRVCSNSGNYMPRLQGNPNPRLCLQSTDHVCKLLAQPLGDRPLPLSGLPGATARVGAHSARADHHRRLQPKPSNNGIAGENSELRTQFYLLSVCTLRLCSTLAA